jgi:hypothetical protein
MRFPSTSALLAILLWFGAAQQATAGFITYTWNDDFTDSGFSGSFTIDTTLLTVGPNNHSASPPPRQDERLVRFVVGPEPRLVAARVPVPLDDVLVPAVVGEHRAHGAIDEQQPADDRVGVHGLIVRTARRPDKENATPSAAPVNGSGNPFGTVTVKVPVARMEHQRAGSLAHKLAAEDPPVNVRPLFPWKGVWPHPPRLA